LRSRIEAGISGARNSLPVATQKARVSLSGDDGNVIRFPVRCADARRKLHLGRCDAVANPRWAIYERVMTRPKVMMTIAIACA
jgi:hypothetical protein